MCAAVRWTAVFAGFCRCFSKGDTETLAAGVRSGTVVQWHRGAVVQWVQWCSGAAL